MHELHLVGFTADHDGLIFSTKKGATFGAYVVGLDDALFGALEEARRMAMADPVDAAARAAAERVRALRPTQRSSLSVRDIQSRLRSGMTLAEVAAEAGVDENWVARFAAPVLAEQDAIIERALGFSLVTARKGPSSRPLGDAVRWNLSDRGISADTTPRGGGWTAFQLEPGQWAIRFSYSSRGRSQMAEWDVDLEASVVSARNRSASELGYVEAGARRRKPPEVSAPPAPTAKKATSGRKGTPARTSMARVQAAKATSSKAAAARAKATRTTSASRPAPASTNLPTSTRKGASRTTPTTIDPPRRTTPAAATPSGRKRPVVEVPARPAPTPGRPETPAKPTSTRDTARFPAPRPAAAGGPAVTSARPHAPAVARQPRSEPAARPARPAEPIPAPRPVPSVPVSPFRRVAPPGPERLASPTADPRRVSTARGPERPDRAEGPGPERPDRAEGAPTRGGAERTPAVRRIPSPTPAAALRRVEHEPSAPVLSPEPQIPTPEPTPPPVPPQPAPATVRPVGGGDGRPTILIIDADRAGDRRRS